MVTEVLLMAGEAHAPHTLKTPMIKTMIGINVGISGLLHRC